FGEVGIGGLQAGANFFETDAVAVDQRGVNADTNSRTRTAPGENLADSFDLGKFLSQDRVGSVIKLGRRNIRGSEREKKDWRIGWIDLAVRRLRRKVDGQLS